MSKPKDLEKEVSILTEKLVTVYDELSLVYEFISKLSSIFDVPMVLEEVLNEAVNISNANWGFILLKNELSSELEISRVSAKIDVKVLEEAIKEGIESNYELGGLIGKVLQEGRTMLGEAIMSEEEALFSAKSSVLAVPLKFKDSLIGIICLSDKITQEPFSSQDIKRVEAFAFIAAIIIENAKLYTQLQRLFISAVEALSFAIDEKDSYTNGHSKRVTQYALDLAKALDGFSEQKLLILKLSAIMHDVGKIGIPEAILHKKEKLEPFEWEEIKKHPLKGIHIIEPITELKTTDYFPPSIQTSLEEIKQILPAIRHHHERYDGNGYPDKLCGDIIPLIARIIAVADAYDAMTSDRAYRKGMSNEEACQELEKYMGKQHDPELVKKFIELRNNGKHSGIS